MVEGIWSAVDQISGDDQQFELVHNDVGCRVVQRADEESEEDEDWRWV
jgi:hypothetical protein